MNTSRPSAGLYTLCHLQRPYGAFWEGAAAPQSRHNSTHHTNRQPPPTFAKASAVPRGTIVALSLYALHQNAKMNSQFPCAFIHFLLLFQTQCTTSFVYLLSGHFSLPFPPTSKKKHCTSVPFCLAGMASRPGGEGAVNAP